MQDRMMCFLCSGSLMCQSRKGPENYCQSLAFSRHSPSQSRRLQNVCDSVISLTLVWEIEDDSTHFLPADV